MTLQKHTLKLKASAVLLALILSACGQQGAAPRAGDVNARHADACALIADSAALFGKDAQIEPDTGLDDMAGTCRFTSADARRGADVILYNSASLGAVTPQAKLADVFARWDELTYTPLAPVEGLGEEAQIAIDLPGYQTQIGFRKGGAVVVILGRSGDPAMDGEKLARAIAAQAASAASLAPAP